MGEYRNLSVFQKAHAVTCDIHRITNKLPPRERFGLIDQIRRASTSIGANLAEGCGRNSDGEFAHHVSIALGSANELTYLLELATDTDMLQAEKSSAWMDSVIEVRRMLASLLASVQTDRHTSPRRSRRKAGSPHHEEDASPNGSTAIEQDQNSAPPDANLHANLHAEPALNPSLDNVRGVQEAR